MKHCSMKHCSILFFLVLLLVACDDNSLIKSEMDRFLNTKVELNLDSMAYASELNTIQDSVVHYKMKDYAYIVYFDSLSCSDCAINHLSDWTDLTLTKHLNDNDISLLFIISPPKKKIKKIIDKLCKNTLMNDQIYVDTMSVFARTNPNIPSNSILHTFLINEQGKVLLIGSPLHNNKIMDLSLEIIKSK